MLFKKLFVGFLLLVSLDAAAQKIKSQLTFRILKTATSLLEAQQFEAAEQYFRNGLQKSIQFQDVYCQAFANEGLGNYFAKTEQPDSAAFYYKKAIKLYRSQNLNVISNVVESLLKSVQGIGDLYAGIEVGAKGVKLSIIEVMLNKDKQYAYTLKMDTSINTDAASLSYQSEKETRDAVAKGTKKNKKPVVKDDRKNFIKSTYAAARYLKDRTRNLDNDPLLVVASYNCGVGNVWEAMKKTGLSNPDFWDVKNYLPAETRSYVMNFIALNVIFHNYEKFVNNTLNFKDIKIKTANTEANAATAMPVSLNEY